MNNLTLPADLMSVVGTEKIDFSVMSKRNEPVKNSLGVIFFGTFWTAFTSIFVVALFGRLFKRVPSSGFGDKPQAIIVPSLIIGLFLLIGIGLLWWGFSSLLKKGGYFVGTNTRLIHYHKGQINTYDWEQFTGNTEVNTGKGDLSLQLRSGKMVSRGSGSGKFVPEVVYLSGIAEVLKIEKICRQRIKENDPTPPQPITNL